MTTDVTTNIDELPPVAKRPSLVKRFVKNPTGVIAFFIFAAIVMVCSLAPLFTKADPLETSFMNAQLPFGTPGHPFGTDGVGHDVLARLLYGGRTSISAAVVAVFMAALIGVPLGLIAGYYQGKIDLVLSWFTNVLMSLPGILVLLIIISIIGTKTYLSMAFFGVMMSPSVFRLIRSQATSVREELYVDAARVAGIKDARIIRKHILPVVVQPSIIQLSLLMGVGIMVQAGIEFLGFGDPDRASWGAMLLDAFQNLYLNSSLLIYPSLALVLTVVALGLIGNALRDTVGAGIVKTSVESDVALLDATAREGVASVAKQATVGESVLDVEGLSVGYKKPDGSISVVVDNVNLAVSKGEVLGLVGESGSGKTQTAFAIMRLLPKSAIVSAKRVGFCGIDLKELGKLGWPIDGYSVHSYPSATGGPTERLDGVAQFKTMLAVNGAPVKPIYDSEVNYGLAGLGQNHIDLDPQTASAYISRTFIDSVRYGIDYVFWFLWTPAYYNKLGVQLNPTTGVENRAWAITYDWLVGSRMQRCSDASAASDTSIIVTECQLTKGDGQLITLAWTNGKPAVIDTTGLGTVFQDLTGAGASIVNNSVTVGPKPVAIR